MSSVRVIWYSILALIVLGFLVFIGWLIVMAIVDYNSIADCAERGGIPINYAPGVVKCL